jgi:tetratricopeptide (TPR) repeat protein
VGSALSLWREFLGRNPEDREAEESIPWLWILQRCEEPATAPTEAPDFSSLALECAEKNLKRDPNRPAFLRDLGAVKLHLRRLDEAESLLEKACRLNPKMVSAAFHLSVVYQLRGKTEEARSSFQAASTALRNAQVASASAEAISRIRAFAQRALDGKVDSGVR